MVSTLADGYPKPVRPGTMAASVGPTARYSRSTGISDRERRRQARRPMSDWLYNLVVFTSVVLFMILATGVGVLAIQSSLR